MMSASRTKQTVLEKRLTNLNLTKIKIRMIVITLKATTARCGISDSRTRLDDQRPNVQDRSNS
jgi:hypothetical protein